MEKMINNPSAINKKYGQSGFMYTEYPHKSFWDKDFGEEEYKRALVEYFGAPNPAGSMLYVHVPFCAKLCWFCTCHMFITKNYEKIHNHLQYLLKEIDLLKQFFDSENITPHFREIHLGGGSPTYLNQEDFADMMGRLGQLTDLKKLDEISIEIDPRQTTPEMMDFYADLGINRISFGVQDFDPDVQKAVNRIQPAELIERLITPEIRKKFKSVNFDIICGLPGQTEASITNTMREVSRLSPDRVCLNYLHYAPHHAPAQTLMKEERIPDFFSKKKLFNASLEVLEQEGYLRTGYDHFAKPEDDVGKAMLEKKMHWNSLGVTPGRVVSMIGVGVHSYGNIDNKYYVQNVLGTDEYESMVEQGKLPILRGYKLNRDDVIRRDVIEKIRNFFEVEFSEVEAEYDINFREYFAKELEKAQAFVEDGMIEVKEGKIEVTEFGKQITTLVCRVFDKYYDGDEDTSVIARSLEQLYV